MLTTTAKGVRFVAPQSESEMHWDPEPARKERRLQPAAEESGGWLKNSRAASKGSIKRFLAIFRTQPPVVDYSGSDSRNA